MGEMLDGTGMGAARRAPPGPQQGMMMGGYGMYGMQVRGVG